MSGLLIALLIMPRDLADEPRQWVSHDGRFTVEARLLEYDPQSVRLLRTDGVEVTVPLARLSKADQRYVRGLLDAAERAGAAQADELASVKARLRAQGILLAGAGAVLTDEAAFLAGFRAMQQVRRELLDAEQRIAALAKQEEDRQESIRRLRQLNVQLNAQLATVSRGDVTLNNRLVGSINANTGRIQLLEQQARAAAEQQQAARDEAGAARDRYVEHVLRLRAEADAIAGRYEQLAADPEVRELLERWQELNGAVELAASRRMRLHLNRLEALEESVLSEAIGLRVGSGGSLFVPATIGDHSVEMLVDSGANLVFLPRAVAEQCGIEVPTDAATLVLELADGRRIGAKLVTIPELRVGPFAVADVPCAVLDADPANAVPLLGMSFLERFTFQISVQDATLTMTRVDPLEVD